MLILTPITGGGILPIAALIEPAVSTWKGDFRLKSDKKPNGTKISAVKELTPE